MYIKDIKEEELKNDTFISMESYGEIPSPRFGHSVSLVSQSKLILFGGAVGDTNEYTLSNETYLYNMNTKIWMCLNQYLTSKLPEARAVHAYTTNDKNQLLIHGGSTKSKSISYI